MTGAIRSLWTHTTHIKQAMSSMQPLDTFRQLNEGLKLDSPILPGSLTEVLFFACGPNTAL